MKKLLLILNKIKKSVYLDKKILPFVDVAINHIEIVKKQIESERNPYKYTDKNITVYDNELLEDTTEEVEESDSIMVFNKEWETVYEK